MAEGAPSTLFHPPIAIPLFTTMFSTGSPYSPFFTSGLLSSPSPSSSRPQSPDVYLRRGSLPTDSPSACATSPDESAAFYFTLQPKRDESECRSFLSLDLAESQSLRSASLKRKVSANASRPRLPSFSKFPSIPEVPHLAPSPTPSRLRHSRATIPSPKPAPSITLPEVPKSPVVSSAPPRLPSIPIIPSIRFSSLKSAPPITSHTVTPKAIVKLPKRHSVLTTSTVSTRARRNNRSDALARLEGRIRPPIILASKHLQRRNFMSMTDEDDAAESDLDDFDFCNDAYMEREDIVLPSSPPRRSSAPSTISSMKRRQQAQRQTKDWFPLQSFMDLHAEDDASRWSWRSFIEIATLV